MKDDEKFTRCRQLLDEMNPRSLDGPKMGWWRAIQHTWRERQRMKAASSEFHAIAVTIRDRAKIEQLLTLVRHQLDAG